MNDQEIDKMAIIAYNPSSGGTNLHHNIGHHAERSASSLRAELPPQMPAALSQGQGNATSGDCAGCSRPSAQRSCNTGSGALAVTGGTNLQVSPPSIEAAQITLRSRHDGSNHRRLPGLVFVQKARRVRQEERNGQLFNVFPDGTYAPADPDYDRYRDSFVVAVQQATGLIKGGKTLPLDAITVLLTRIVVHMGERERSCRLYRLPVVLALIGCPDDSGIAPEEEAIARRANKTERAIAAAIRSLCLDGGEMESPARRAAGVPVREIRTTKGGK